MTESACFKPIEGCMNGVYDAVVQFRNEQKGALFVLTVVGVEVLFALVLGVELIFMALTFPFYLLSQLLQLPFLCCGEKIRACANEWLGLLGAPFTLAVGGVLAVMYGLVENPCNPKLPFVEQLGDDGRVDQGGYNALAAFHNAQSGAARVGSSILVGLTELFWFITSLVLALVTLPFFLVGALFLPAYHCDPNEVEAGIPFLSSLERMTTSGQALATLFTCQDLLYIGKDGQAVATLQLPPQP